ncbi:hypothetical protein [Helicobacter felistomachi]|nr:hypothetical protein [Helicobacter sp. NHP21005]
MGDVPIRRSVCAQWAKHTPKQCALLVFVSVWCAIASTENTLKTH